MEDWRDIPGFEGIYQISQEGRIRRVKVLTNDARLVLIDSDKKRHNIKVDKIFKQVFNENILTTSKQGAS